MDKLEAKFQLSIQFDIWNNINDSNIDLYIAYTQQAFWQVYNRDVSSPFRETNYEPEVGIKFSPDFEIWGFNNSQIRLGLVHQSNGRAEPLSRSWNRVFALIVFDKGNFATIFRPWIRIPESEEDDNNPDIDDFLGNFEWYGFYKDKKAVVGFMLRSNLDSNENRGAIQLDWSYPLSDRVKWYVQYFNGYGENLLDYNHSNNRISAGFMLTDWL
jgi:phospholipase A1